MSEQETIDGAAVEEHDEDDGARTYVAPSSDVATVSPAATVAVRDRAGLSVEDVVARVEKVRQIADRVMKKDIHYGVIPGVQKPSLFKPGAEVLCVTFELDPETTIEREHHDQDGHLDVVAKTTLYHIPSGMRVAGGIGSCSTRETRYAMRQGARTCPECGSEAIIRGKKEYGGGWLCFAKKGGCGAKWSDDDEQAHVFENTDTARVARPREELADAYNTVRKMASKRSLIDAILRGTAASEIYTQDVEDFAPQVAPQPTRREGPPPMTVPKSWAKINELAAQYDVDLHWPEWSRQAAVAMFGGEADLTKDQKKVASQKAAGAIVALFDLHPPSVFPPPDTAEVRRAWASVLDGVELEGPPDDAGTPVTPATAGADSEAGGTPESAETGAGRAADGAYESLSPEEQAEIDRLADESFGSTAETSP